MNGLTTVDIISFIFRSIVGTKSNVDQKSFISLIDAGRFVFVFDGFDEVSIDKRELVQTQILDLCARSKANVVVVSGRPDDRFDAWQEFSKYRVEPLELSQVVSLVERVAFDIHIKRKFVESLKNGLYKAHSSFLSSPLLATMMLLTFENYAHIPDKIHVFYDVAFATLFSRHDTLKEAFKREKYTNFSIDVFKTQLSYLCVLTYQDERFSFSETELLSYIVKSAVLSNKTFVAEDFMKDLLESVCIMQQDGLDITFSHRSFQEYFTAVYLENMPREGLKALLPRLAKRGTDSVFAMFNDMNRELLEEAYVMPMIKKAKRVSRAIGPLSGAIDIVNAYRVEVLVTPRFVAQMAGCFYLTDSQQNEVWRFREISMRLYKDMYMDVFDKHDLYLSEDKQLRKKIPTEILEKADRRELLSLSRQNNPEKSSLSAEQLIFMQDLFEQSGSAHLLIDTEACFAKVLNEVPRDNRKRSKRVREVLRIS